MDVIASILKQGVALLFVYLCLLRFNDAEESLHKPMRYCEGQPLTTMPTDLKEGYSQCIYVKGRSKNIINGNYNKLSFRNNNNKGHDFRKIIWLNDLPVKEIYMYFPLSYKADARHTCAC